MSLVQPDDKSIVECNNGLTMSVVHAGILCSVVLRSQLMHRAKRKNVTRTRFLKQPRISPLYGVLSCPMHLSRLLVCLPFTSGTPAGTVSWIGVANLGEQGLAA